MIHTLIGVNQNLYLHYEQWKIQIDYLYEGKKKQNAQSMLNLLLRTLSYFVFIENLQKV